MLPHIHLPFCRGVEQHCAGLVISGMQQPQVGASVRGEGWLQLMPGQCVAFSGLCHCSIAIDSRNAGKSSMMMLHLNTGHC
jgi:hypothetical protein